MDLDTNHDGAILATSKSKKPIKVSDDQEYFKNLVDFKQVNNKGSPRLRNRNLYKSI